MPDFTVTLERSVMQRGFIVIHDVATPEEAVDQAVDQDAEVIDWYLVKSSPIDVMLVETEGAPCCPRPPRPQPQFDRRHA